VISVNERACHRIEVIDFSVEKDARIPVVKLEQTIKSLKNAQADQDVEYSDDLPPSGDRLEDEETQQKIRQEFEGPLKSIGRDDREAQEIQAGKIDGINFLVIIGAGREHSNQEFWQRKDLDKEKNEESDEKILWPLRSLAKEFVVLRLLGHQDISGRHDDNDNLNHQNRPFIDGGSRKRTEDEKS